MTANETKLLADIQCYACPRPHTTMDHCPPLAFFPARKDVPPEWPDFRVDLNTVPSCDEHNQAVSQDDEYAFYMAIVLTMKNPVSAQLLRTKIKRGLNRFRDRREFVFGNEIEISVPKGEPMIGIPVDRDRFDRVMTKIARGLYYEEHGRGKRWDGTLYVQSNAFFKRDEEAKMVSPNPAFVAIQNGVMLFDYLGRPRCGSNPRVFYYQFMPAGILPDMPEMMRLVFYEELEILILSDRDRQGDEDED